MTATPTTIVVTMDAEGRLTLPVAARRALAVEGAASFTLEVAENALILRPADAIPDEDAWAYTPEHLARVERARNRPLDQDRQLSTQDLERLLSGES